jgi:hypothetical protein
MAVRGRKSMWSVAAGLSPAEMAPANARRLGLIVRNVGKKTAFLGDGKAVEQGVAGRAGGGRGLPGHLVVGRLVGLHRQQGRHDAGPDRDQSLGGGQ